MLTSTKYLTGLISTFYGAAILMGGAPTSPTPAYNRWESLHGGMMAGRSGACSVQMPNGQILIMGGTGSDIALDSAEFFDGDSRFNLAAPMNEARTGHGCALLPDGSVIVVGGRTGSGALINSSEVYDPVTNSWAAGPPPLVARAEATISTLRDGRLLIAGGETWGGASKSLEVYDPATRQFIAIAAQLSSARKGHAAVLLTDGRVLIAGGSDGSNALDTVEVFDPGKGRTSPAGRMMTPREGLTATVLLNGRVLILGGRNGQSEIATAEIFDSVTGACTPLPSLMRTARRNPIAIRLRDNNSVLIVGGTSDGKPVSQAELYLPWTKTFQALDNMAVPRTGAVGNSLSRPGRLLVAGGRNETGVQSGGEIFAYPTLRTDKANFNPGDSVTFSGTGWIPDVPLKISATEDPDVISPASITTVADNNGNISFATIVPDKDNGAATFYTAVQQGSADANGKGLTLAAQVQASGNLCSNCSYTVNISPAGSVAGAPVTFSITVTNTSASKDIGVIQICVPLNYALPVSATGPAGWTPSITAGGTFLNGNTCSSSFVSVTNSGPGTLIGPGGTGNVTISTTGNSTGTGQWTFGLNSNAGVGGQNYPDPASGYPPTTAVTNASPTLISMSPNSATVGSASLNVTLVGTGFSASSVAKLDGASLPTAFVDATHLIATIPATAMSSAGGRNITVFNPAPGGGTSGALTFTVLKGDQSISVTTHAPATAPYNSSFSVAATASSGLPVTITGSGGCSGGGTGSATLTIASMSSCTVAYSQPGDANWNAASPVSETTTAGKLSQTISITTHAPANAVFNTSFAVAASASSGLPVSLLASGGCSGSGTGSANITMTSGVNGCTVTYSQAGNATYNAALNAVESTSAAKAAATLNVPPSTSVPYNGSPQAVTVTTTPAGLATVNVTYSGNGSTSYPSSSTPPTNAGSYTVSASLSNADYQATTATGTLTITPLDQTITVTKHALSSAVFNTTFDVAATASSGLAVSIAGSGGCSGSGSGSATLTMTSGTNACTVTYSQAGNSNYNAASSLTETSAATKGTATLQIPASTTVAYNGSPQVVVATTSPAGLTTVTVTYAGTGSTSYPGSTAPPTNAGTYSVSATLANDNYQATATSGTLTITPADQTITVTTPAPAAAAYNGSFTVAATASSGLAVSISASGGCSGSGSGSANLTMTSGTDSCTVTYSQTGNENYHAAPSRTETTTATKATATLNVSANTTVAYNGSPRGVMVTTSPAGLTTVTVTYTGSGATSYPSSTTSPTNGGTYIVSATLSNPNYQAVPATGTLTITALDQTIMVTVHAPAIKPTGSTFDVAATASSGLPVSIVGSGACSGSGSGSATLTMTGATSNCTVTYSQAGNSNYSPAPNVTEMTAAARADQTITVTKHAVSSAAFNTSFDVAATASSGLPVSITGSGGCSGSGSGSAVLTMSSGTNACVVTYSQAGNPTYNAAPSVTETSAATKATATLQVPASTTVAYSASPQGVVVTISPAGLTTVTVTYAGTGSTSYPSSTTPPTNAGTYSVLATLANDNYQAPAGSGTLTITPAEQTITVTTHAPATAAYNGTFTVAATASSGLAVSISGSGGCSGSGSGSTTLMMTGGTNLCTITYTQAGNANFNPAAAVTETASASKATATLILPASTTVPYTGNPHPVAVSVNPVGLSGIAVTYVGSGSTSYSSSTTPPTNAGTYAIAATLSNANYDAAPVAGALVITPIDQIITVTTHAPASAVFNVGFNVAATASSGLAVTITGSGGCSGTGSGSATITITTGTACAVKFTQAGDGNHNPAPAITETTSASKIPTSLTTPSGIGPIAAGSTTLSTILGISISSSNAPTGTITFTDNGATIGSVNVSSGVGAYSITVTLNTGNHNFGATYSGDSRFAPAQSGSLFQNIGDKAATPVTVTISSDPPAPTVGQPVKFTVVVNGQNNPALTAQIYDGSTLLGTAPVINGIATFTVNLPGGYHNVYATVDADGRIPVRSNIIGQPVYVLKAAVGVVVNPSPTVYGQPLTLTATLNAQPPAGVAPPSGQVQFFDGTTLIGTGTLSSGVATVPVSGLGAGVHQISAMYIGDQNFAPVKSSSVAQTVKQASTVTKAVALPNVSGPTPEVSLTAAVGVMLPGGGVPTGYVQFVDADTNAVLGTAPLVGGIATLKYTPASTAARRLTATYSGSLDFSGSNSLPTSQVAIVNAADFVTLRAAPDSIMTLFGANLADSTQNAASLPLPISLSGTVVTVADSAGIEHSAQLFYASPTQINVLIPGGVAPGKATVTIKNTSGESYSIIMTAERTAPGLFSANANGQGVAAAQIVRVRENGNQSVENVGRYEADSKTAVPVPIDFESDNDVLFLTLYGTGLRNAQTAKSVTATINGEPVPVLYLGPQPTFVGLDQINLGAVPRSFKGSGTVDVQVTIDGDPLNIVTVTFK